MDERLYYKEIVYNMCLGSIEEEKGGQKMKKYILGNVLRLFSCIYIIEIFGRTREI